MSSTLPRHCASGIGPPSMASKPWSKARAGSAEAGTCVMTSIMAAAARAINGAVRFMDGAPQPPSFLGADGGAAVSALAGGGVAWAGAVLAAAGLAALCLGGDGLAGTDVAAVVSG